MVVISISSNFSAFFLVFADSSNRLEGGALFVPLELLVCLPFLVRTMVEMETGSKSLRRICVESVWAKLFAFSKWESVELFFFDTLTSNNSHNVLRATTLALRYPCQASRKNTSTLTTGNRLCHPYATQVVVVVSFYMCHFGCRFRIVTE